MSRESASRREVTVNLREGLHLRPLSLLAQTAGRFAADVRISNGTVTVDAKDQWQLPTLAAEYGTVLVLEADGDDAAEAIDSLVELFESDFHLDAADQP